LLAFGGRRLAIGHGLVGSGQGVVDAMLAGIVCQVVQPPVLGMAQRPIGALPKSIPAGLADAPLLSWLTLIPRIHQMRRKPMPDSAFPLHGTTDKRADATQERRVWFRIVSR
jgi:hypothetical protein